MNQIPVPTVLECIRFVASNPHKHQRIARNYEFDLYLDGKHKIRIDGISYDDTDQCLIFRKPGQFTEGIGDYNMYALTLDFSDSMFHPQKLYRNTWGNIQPLCDFKELNELPSVFRPAHFEELKNLLDKLSLASAGESNDHLQQQYAKEFLLLALYDACNFMRTQDAQKADGNPYVKKAREYITKNFYRDITVKQIAQELHLNQNHFIKLFKKELRQTPNQYLLETRLLRAQQLILQTNIPIQDVAFSCGFNSPSYFAKCFYNRFQILPLEMRRKNQL